MANGRRIAPGAAAFTPRPYGLWSVVEDRSAAGLDHWQMGINYEVLCPTATLTYDPCLAVTGTGPTPPPPAKAETTDRSWRGATAFTVVEEIDCSPVGFSDQAEAIVTEALTRSEMRQVEAAFWTGQAAGQQVVWPHLAAASPFIQEGFVLQTAAVSAPPLTGTGVVDPVEGLGYLEQALAGCYDGVGVIHVPVALAAHLAAYDLISRQGAQLRTAAGNLVAVGAGYPGTSPSGVEPVTAEWAYATGAVFGYRSTIRTFPLEESFDRSVNTVKAIAERTYLLGWDCCHFAVPISTAGVALGTAGIQSG